MVSLSSCESELHAMVSIEADALFLKHCVEVVTSAKVEHYVYTDSSAARQLAQRQGVGRTKHVSGKLLWIEVVQSGRTILVQVPTAGNLADIGTRPLFAKRMRVLLHELCICSE